jgi:hypothetical protein
MKIRIVFFTLFSLCFTRITVAEPLDIKQTSLLCQEQLVQIDMLLKDAQGKEREQLLLEQKSIEILMKQLEDTQTIESLKIDSETIIAELKKELESTRKLLMYLGIGTASAAVVAGIVLVGVTICGGFLIWGLRCAKKDAENSKNILSRLVEDYQKAQPKIHSETGEKPEPEEINLPKDKK